MAFPGLNGGLASIVFKALHEIAAVAGGAVQDEHRVGHPAIISVLRLAECQIVHATYPAEANPQQVKSAP